jgi:hypothetical protein
VPKLSSLKQADGRNCFTNKIIRNRTSAPKSWVEARRTSRFCVISPIATGLPQALFSLQAARLGVQKEDNWDGSQIAGTIER